MLISYTLIEYFEFCKGGKQGGVETPVEFNMFMESNLEALVLSWQSRGYGFDYGMLSGSCSALIKHWPLKAVGRELIGPPKGNNTK